MRSKSVAFVGTVGVPNVYGGFEAFLEAVVPELAQCGHVVSVTCDSSRYANREKYWSGASRVFIPVRANGAASILHDFLAFFAVFNGHKNIVFLGVSAGIFFPLFRLVCALTNSKLIVNVDGIEWRRSKFGWLKRCFIKFSDACAQLFAHCVVVDNEGLKPYLTRVGRGKSVYIPYSGDHVIRLEHIESATRKKLLSICRIEPENNCDMLLSAFKKLSRGDYVFVGNWNDSSYGRNLRKFYSDVPGLIMSDPIYDPQELALLRESCVGYIHGHSVGGTNPSLVEMLFYDAPIAAFDCVFNRNVAVLDAEYFSNEYQLALLMNKFLDSNERVLKAVRASYTRSAVVDSYRELFI